MTPKEKAEKLVNKFRDYADGTDSETDRFSPNIERKNAKQCALIAVNEILKELDVEIWGLEMYEAFDRQSYWQEVKQEIEKL